MKTISSTIQNLRKFLCNYSDSTFVSRNYNNKTNEDCINLFLFVSEKSLTFTKNYESETPSYLL